MDCLLGSALFYKPYLKMLSLSGDPYQLLGKYAFRKYKLSGPPTQSKIFNEGALLPFWSKVGSSLTHLKINEAYVAPLELFMRILTEMTPKIQFLSLDQCSGPISVRGEPYPYTRDKVTGVNVPAWNMRLLPKPSEVRSNLTHFENTYRGSFGIPWAYFFLRFPNIQTLKLQVLPRPSYGSRMQTHYDNPNDERLRIFECLQIVRANGAQNPLSNLQNLDLLNFQWEAIDLFRQDIKDLLSELAFPLSSLSIDIGFEQDEAGFRRILELYSLTLKKLLVYRGPYVEPFIQDFPYGVALPNLEELRLIGPIWGNLDFFKSTPSLKTLVLLDGKTEMEPRVLHSYVDFSLQNLSDKTFGGRVTSNDANLITNLASGFLKNLELPQMEEFIVGHELCGGAQVEALAKLMPGLRKLRIGLDNEGFKATCKNWTQLRHLDIEPFDVEEEGLLGMENGEKYFQPNITDLKYLMSLRMGDHSSNDSKRGRLTNGSIVDGLLVAESLRNVWFRRNPTATPKVRQLLASKFPQ